MMSLRLRCPQLASLLLLTLPITTAFAQAKQQGSAATTTAALNATRAALDKYKDPLVAVRDGYFSTLGCVTYPTGGGHDAMAYKPGAMGVHFLNPQAIGPKIDSLHPQVLIYEPVGDKLRLVAAEWLVPTSVSKTPPTIFGRQLEGPMEGHEPIMPAALRHWDLHVWLWKDNPYGVFSPTNSAVKCPTTGYGYSFNEAAPKIVTP
jgi:hypothetical protein